MFVADGEVRGRPHTSVAEFNLVGEDGAVMDRTSWIASADDAETVYAGGAPAAAAIDGDPATLWHTSWFELEAPPPHPHYLMIDLGASRVVSGFRYLPRQDSSSGRVSVYRFFSSVDGQQWGEPAVQGVFENTALEQGVDLP
jgi:hypothetical protein